TVYVFYGGGDHVIGLATCALDELIDFALHG
ncbi:MAG: glycosidase, partial [Caldilineae bacterium]